MENSENSDDAIERVLAGLGNAEPPAGMDQRILQAVRDNAPEKRRRSLPLSWRTFWAAASPVRKPATGTARWSLAAAAVVLVSSLACWTALRNHSAVSDHQAVSPLPATPDVHATTVSPQLPSQPRSVLRVAERTPDRAPDRTNARHASRVREVPSANPDSMGAGNHPAPEAPLTEQEKLLLRLAHKNDPVELAVLNPVLWAARDAEEKAEVKKFFEPPTTAEDK